MARKPANKAKTTKKPSAKTSAPSTDRIVKTTTFRDGETGKIVHLDLKTKPAGKVITASVGGRVKSIAIAR